MNSVFQLDPSVPGAANTNSLIALQQEEYGFLSTTNQAGKMLQDALAGANGGDKNFGKVSVTGVAWNELTEVQQNIFDYGTTEPFDSANVPQAIWDAIKANPGPTAMWNASYAQAGVVAVAGVTPLVGRGSVITPSGTRLDNVFILPQ